MSSTTCPACGTVVPQGAFCGACGAHLSPQRGNGPDRLRIKAYGAAPTEHLLSVSVISSLFPHLPHRSRAAFRVGLAALVIVLLLAALLRWQAALIGISALGFPLLFQIYLQESDVYRDLPVRAMLAAAISGAVLGVGWALLTGPVVARSYTAGFGVPAQVVLRDGLAIPVGSAVLMLLPVVLVRALHRPTRESLDGYLIGSLGAVVYTAAGVLTRLLPQLATGPIAHHRTVAGLLTEAGIQGVAMPLTAAAAGGLVGAALWYTGRSEPTRGARYWAALALAVAVVLAVYAGIGLVDVGRLEPGLQLTLHLVITVLAVLSLRVALHTALLHEAHETVQGEPLLCAHCHHVVPSMPFCPNCGVANRAASRHSRDARRLVQPTSAETRPDVGPGAPATLAWTGYAVPAPSYLVPPVRHTSHIRLALILGVALLVVVVAAVVVSRSVTPPPPTHPKCPPSCETPPPIQPSDGPPVSDGGRPPAGLPAPPHGPPVQNPFPLFTAGDGGFAVAMPPRAIKSTEVNGLRWKSRDGDSLIVLYGEPAKNRTPSQIAQNIIDDKVPGASTAYQIPNAMLGYQPGYGEIDDYYPPGSFASQQHLRVLVMVAVKNGLALVAFAEGPRIGAIQDHSTGAGLLVADVINPFINSFRWRGDPPR